MSGVFTHVLSADKVRKFKTAPEVYQLGVDAFDRPAARLVFVSSNGWMPVVRRGLAIGRFG